MDKQDQCEMTRIERKRRRKVIGGRNYKCYSMEMLEIAMEKVQKNIMSSRKAEQEFGVPRRTIENKIKKLHMGQVGGQRKLSEEVEETLVGVVIASADFGYPMTKLDLKMLIHKYLQKNHMNDIFNDDLPTDWWIESFLKRYASKLNSKTTVNLKRVKGKKYIIKDFEQFFTNLEDALKNVLPSNIVNYNEFNLSDDLGSSIYISRRSIKYPERVRNNINGTSIILTACADGTCLPVYIVYKAMNLYSEWVKGGPHGARYNCTKTGWFDTISFEDYFKTIILEWAKNVPGVKVVVGDHLSSHLSIEVVELCQKHNIRFVFSPSNSTNLLQPLDAAFFAPMEKEWQNILLDYKIKNPGLNTLNKKYFPKLLMEVMENIKVRDANAIQNGFRVTGIWPVNARYVYKRTPEINKIEIEKVQKEEVLLNCVKELVSSVQNQINKNKKLSIDPGKSVCSEDVKIKINNTYKKTKTNVLDEKVHKTIKNNNVQDTKSNVITITENIDIGDGNNLKERNVLINNEVTNIERKRRRTIIEGRNYKNYSMEKLELAVEKVRKNIMSSREAEREFGIPRRTILNKIKNLHMGKPGGQRKLNEEIEENLVKVLIASGDFGSPMTKLDLKMLVHEYLQNNCMKNTFHNNMPSDQWIESLLNRHSSKLNFRTTQNMSRVKAKKGVKSYEQFFNNLEETLKGVLPANIVNFDEKKLSDNLGSTKYVFRRSLKYPERLPNNTNAGISIIITACADGTSLPVYVVYKTKNLNPQWVQGGPVGARYNCSKSGWSDSSSFDDYFRTIILEWARNIPETKVLIGNNLSSRLSIEVLESCQKHNIKFIFLPPKAHHLQPLDVAYYAPLKREWKNIILDYKKSNPKQEILKKKHFPKLLTELIVKIKLRETSIIQSGFRFAGIWPVNARHIFNIIFDYSGNDKHGIHEESLDYGKDGNNPLLIPRTKKLCTEPAMAVHPDDIKINTNSSDDNENKSNIWDNKLHNTTKEYTVQPTLHNSNENNNTIVTTENKGMDDDNYIADKIKIFKINDPNQSSRITRVEKKRCRRVAGARKYKNYTTETLKTAVDEVRRNVSSSNEAARKYGIPRRTIINKIGMVHMRPVGRQRKLNDEIEEKLVQVLIANRDLGSLMTKLDVKMQIQKYLNEHSINNMFNDNMPSDSWIDSFLKRYSLQLNLRTRKKRKSVNAEKNYNYFEQFYNFVEDRLNNMLPSNRANYNQMNLSENPGPSIIQHSSDQLNISKEEVFNEIGRKAYTQANQCEQPFLENL